MHRLFGAALAFALFAAPARADPVWQGVYEGVVGPSRVIVSLKPEGARYVYVTKPNDLGLIVKETSDGLTMTETLAPNLGADDIRDNPKLITGKWRASLQGDKLEGQWTDAKGGRTRRISLTRVSSQAEGTDQPLNPARLGPYGARWLAAAPDFVPQGSESRVGEVSYTLVRDDLYGNLLPRLTHAPASVRVGAVNNLLDNLHKTIVLRDRNCAQDLRTSTALTDPNRLRGVEKPNKRGQAASQESIKVVYATENLLALLETRSLFCGGAHPSNQITAYTFDLRAPRQIGGLSDEAEDNFGPSGLGGALDIADKAKREKFDGFWTGKFAEKIKSLSGPGTADETTKTCAEDLTRQLGETGGAIDKIVYPLPEGLAIRATGFPHVTSVCALEDSAINPLILPWRDLKPYLKPGQKLLPGAG